MTPDTFHQQALMAVEATTERLAWLEKQTGQIPQETRILQITDAVSSEKCASFDDAIAQLEAPADVFEEQLVSGAYW